MPEGRSGSGMDREGEGAATARVVPAKIRPPVTAALPRERLEQRLAHAWSHRLTLVVAPAGSGKTTLVARLAATAGVPAGWYRAEAWDADAPAFVRHVEAALAAVLPELPRGWTTVEDAARALEAIDPGRALLVVDDLHALEGTDAEAAFGRFVEYAPPWLAIVIASRVVPSVNLTRLRVAGALLELGPDDLRFRAWEVEALFRDVYHDPVPPADLAALAQRVEGWAAGLQLFHLATRGKPIEERRRVLGGAGPSGRLMREYLARNVLSELPPDLRDFLLDTCTLGRLSGALCDRLRGSTGSAAVLEELARRGVFTVPVEDDDDAYRYHEVLRQHLDRMLVEEVGEHEARERHARAGALLEAEGHPSQALRAYCRAEDWGAVRRLLGRQGEDLATAGGAWVDAVPPAIERHDPWVALARARRARNDGRWQEALEAYGRAEAGFGASPAADAPRRERLALAAWLDPGVNPPSEPAGLLRLGLVREPAAVAREVARLADPAASVTRGLLALAAGDVAGARRILGAAVQSGGAGPALTAAARLGSLVAGLLAGERATAGAIEGVIEDAEHAGAGWLARLARDLGPWLTDEAAVPVPGAAEPAEAHQEPWATALVSLAAAWSLARGPGTPGPSTDRRLAAAEEAAGAFRALGAAVPEAWARSLAALLQAEAGAPDARDAARSAEALGRATGAPAALMLAYAALARATPDGTPNRDPDYALLAESVATETGLVLPPALGVQVGSVDIRDGEPSSLVSGTRAAPPAPVRHPDRAPAVRIRTLGGFGLEVHGRRVPLDGAKPRVRMLLRLLAVHAGAPVHREVLQDALWPDADAVAGARSLHVAISAARRVLDDVAQPIGGQLVVRDGDAYRLDLPPAAIDLAALEGALADGRAALARGDDASSALQAVLGLYAGDLLPEDGPAEWVVERREHYRAAAVEAAIGLARQSLLRGDVATTARACRAGLEVDRYQDALWRMLIDARERAGDAGAASRDRTEYRRVLDTLGIGEAAAISPS